MTAFIADDDRCSEFQVQGLLASRRRFQIVVTWHYRIFLFQDQILFL